MKIKATKIDGCYVLQPDIFEDERGCFFESFNLKEFQKIIEFNPVQDNESHSKKGVVRGLHFQKPPHDQAKLVRVVKGSVWDVCVDLREGSPTFGKCTYFLLSDKNKVQFFIPSGCAHGFVSLENDTVLQYKCDNYYNKDSEGCILWDDEQLNIPWELLTLNLNSDIILSEKDKIGMLFEDYKKELKNLFKYE